VEKENVAIDVFIHKNIYIIFKLSNIGIILFNKN